MFFRRMPEFTPCAVNSIRSSKHSYLIAVCENREPENTALWKMRQHRLENAHTRTAGKDTSFTTFFDTHPQCIVTGTKLLQCYEWCVCAKWISSLILEDIWHVQGDESSFGYFFGYPGRRAIRWFVGMLNILSSSYFIGVGFDESVDCVGCGVWCCCCYSNGLSAPYRRLLHPFSQNHIANFWIPANCSRPLPWVNMVWFTGSVIISHARERVWTLMWDWRNHPKWDRNISRSTLLEDRNEREIGLNTLYESDFKMDGMGI